MREQLARLARGAAIYGIGGVLSRVISLLLLPLFTAYLAPADYGVIAMLGLLGFLLVPVFTMGLGTSMGLSYFEPSVEERKSTTVWTAFSILLASSAAMVLFGTLFAREISVLLFRTDAYMDLVVLSILATAAGILSLPFTLALQLEERAALFVVLSTLSSLASIFLTFLMVVVLRGGVRGFVLAGLWSQALMFLAFLAPAAMRKIRWDGQVARDLLKYGFPMIPSFAGLFVLQQGNRYILEHFRGLEELGLYAVGHNIGFAMTLLVNAFSSAWPPYFLSFTGKQEEARALFGRIGTYYVFGLGAVSLLFYLFAKPVVLILTQPLFHSSWSVVGLTATACFFNGAFSLFLPPVYFAKEVRSVTAVQIVAALVSLGLAILLIPPFGIVGAGLTLAGGALAMAALMQAWNAWNRERYLAVAYEWGRIGKFAAVYVVVAIAYCLRRELPVAVEIAVSMTGAAVLFVVVYFLLGESERKAMTGWLSRREEPSPACFDADDNDDRK